MSTEEKRKEFLGHCPFCESEDLDYGAIEASGETVYYPFTCNNCGAKGKEFYNLHYTETVAEREKTNESKRS